MVRFSCVIVAFGVTITRAKVYVQAKKWEDTKGRPEMRLRLTVTLLNFWQ